MRAERPCSTARRCGRGRALILLVLLCVGAPALAEDGPVLTGRITTKDGGLPLPGASVSVPAGAQLALLPGSGNRDPRHYEDPDTFDVRRNPVDHLSFEVLRRPVESALAAAVRVDDRVDAAAQGEGVGQRVDREVGGHSGTDGVG